MSYDEKVADLQERQRLLTGALVSVRKPTIAALPGPAVGAGLALAMACDIRIAAQSAFVSTGYLRVGLSGDYGIAWLLTRLVGTSRARELMFTADKVDAARARRSASSTAWCRTTSCRTRPLRWPDRMAEGPTLALRYMKDNLDEALLFDFATARDHEAERLIRLTMTADHREAVQAFIDKRKPVFTGNSDGGRCPAPRSGSSWAGLAPLPCDRTFKRRLDRDLFRRQPPARAGNVLRRERRSAFRSAPASSRRDCA